MQSAILLTDHPQNHNTEEVRRQPVKRPALGISSSYKLGSAIRKMRLLQGLTQEELARLSGISRTWISHIESGRHNVGINTALHLIGTLGYDIALVPLDRNTFNVNEYVESIKHV